MGSVVIKYFPLEDLETHANIFHSQCPNANLHWFYYHIELWAYIFWLFFKSSQPKIFRGFIIGLLKHVILFSILSEIISSNGWILSCDPEGFIFAVNQRKVLILPNYDTFSFHLVCFIVAQEIYTFLEGFDKGTLLSRWQEKQS